MSHIHNIVGHLNRYLPSTNHWLVLFLSVPVAIATGTLFVYSVYGTQLAEKCDLTAKQTADLNIGATIGTAIGGLVSGHVTDTYGTQLPMLFSCISISLGYRWLYDLYNRGEESTMLELWLAMFLIGCGSVSGYFSSIKAVALHFPNYRSTAQSVTIASFAISSMLFSLISSIAFNGDVKRFLFFLHISSGLLLFIGFLFIRIEDHYDIVKNPDEEDSQALLQREDDELPSVRRMSSIESLKTSSLKKTLSHPVFWCHYILLAVIQGLGQMYIYCVGYVVKAVHYYYTTTFPDESNPSLHTLQASQVSVVAISSFLGRLSSGPSSDYIVGKLHLQRHWILVAGLLVMLVGHLMNLVDMTAFFTSLHGANAMLTLVSVLIGFSYGYSFTCYPAIVADMFNMKNYSFIWGLMYSSTVFGLMVMTKVFGHFYDKNTNDWDDNLHDYVCAKASLCYDDAFKITSFACLLVLGSMLIYIYFRRQH